MSSSAAFFIAVWVMSHHCSENSGTRSWESSSVDWLPMNARVIPTLFMASRSRITPSLEMLLSSQYQYTAARMESGGFRKPSCKAGQGFRLQAISSRAPITPMILRIIYLTFIYRTPWEGTLYWAAVGMSFWRHRSRTVSAFRPIFSRAPSSWTGTEAPFRLKMPTALPPS